MIIFKNKVRVITSPVVINGRTGVRIKITGRLNIPTGGTGIPFSGVDGGSPDTVYTNQIITPAP
jgi:hypothetical protein